MRGISQGAIFPFPTCDQRPDNAPAHFVKKAVPLDEEGQERPWRLMSQRVKVRTVELIS